MSQVSRQSISLFSAVAFTLLHVAVGWSDDQVITLATVVDPGKISPDEPIAAEFSAEQAARYLDTASLYWQKSRKCVTCHTNLGYLIARPALGSALKDSGEVRRFFEEHVEKRWAESSPSPVLAVVVATGLAFNDRQTTGKLHPTTRKALDLMWTVQREDGGWNWLMCGWPPMEVDEHYGVTLAALAVGLAPDHYAETEAAKKGIVKIRKFLEDTPPKSLHHRAMVAWASIRVDGLMDDEERNTTLRDLLARQLPDGGWSTAALFVEWSEFVRKDGKPHDTKTSDAYATGFVIVVARQLGRSSSDPQLKKGIEWIVGNQRASGKWFTRSPTKDNYHYLSNYGSAFAILALQACGRLPDGPLAKAD
jgi:squalene-hopene/tetraprenyl-beta-curcumene cyclase